MNSSTTANPRVLLYRRKLDARSGAGQLIGMQADGLRRAGIPVELVCRRAGFKYFLRTGRRITRLTDSNRDALLNRPGQIVVDHGLELPSPDIVFVHSLATAAALYLDRDDLRAAAEAEARYFGRIGGRVPIVANSGLVKSAMIERLGIEPGRVSVIYPGYDTRRFDRALTPSLRRKARKRLGLTIDTPLAGFVTSGDLELRGLDIFLDAAAIVGAEYPEARFLVAGARRLPGWARDHPVVRGGRLCYRPKGGSPELWMAALDVFVHAGRFEAFGMALAEALALGIPVITSRRIGLAEALPAPYGPWIIEHPDAAALARRMAELLADSEERSALASAGRDLAERLGAERYAEESVRAIRSCAKREP